MDVDCSTITYETPPSRAILSAVDQAKSNLAEAESYLALEEAAGFQRWRRLLSNYQVIVKYLRTQTKEESLSNSLLKQIDPKNFTADEIKEAFCRDIDAFSFEFKVNGVQNIFRSMGCKMS